MTKERACLALVVTLTVTIATSLAFLLDSSRCVCVGVPQHRYWRCVYINELPQSILEVPENTTLWQYITFAPLDRCSEGRQTSFNEIQGFLDRLESVADETFDDAPANRGRQQIV